MIKNGKSVNKSKNRKSSLRTNEHVTSRNKSTERKTKQERQSWTQPRKQSERRSSNVLFLAPEHVCSGACIKTSKENRLLKRNACISSMHLQLCMLICKRTMHVMHYACIKSMHSQKCMLLKHTHAFHACVCIKAVIILFIASSFVRKGNFSSVYYFRTFILRVV